jgi:AmiR/NasT family two-component response regulator
VAAIAITQNTQTVEPGAVLGSLQAAVASRGVVDMAKGVLSESLGIDMPEAFSRLRGYAHHHSLRMTDVARDLVSQKLAASQVTSPAPATPVSAP